MLLPRAARSVHLALLVSLLAVIRPHFAAAGNGDPMGGFPSYRERALLALVNACRQGPTTYRDAYLNNPTILQPSHYPAVHPLYWTLPLNQSSRAHSVDMATTPCFQHNSCDGTDTWTRIRGYYSGGGWMGENIAAGYGTPAAVVKAWLLDGGVADGASGDGHRRNIMNVNFREMGNGSATGGPYGIYDTQDFGGGAPDFTTPLVWGSHALMGDGKVTFFASYHSPTTGAPLEATLLLDDVPHGLALRFGTAASGSYTLALPTGTSCRKYRFRFRDGAGTQWLHPESGWLYTTGEGGCTQEYQAATTDTETLADGSADRAWLGAPVPNPAQGSARFALRLPGGGAGRLRIVSLTGRIVRSLELPEGSVERTALWDGHDDAGRRVAPGVYFVRLESARGTAQKRLVYLGPSR